MLNFVIPLQRTVQYRLDPYDHRLRYCANCLDPENVDIVVCYSASDILTAPVTTALSLFFS